MLNPLPSKKNKSQKPAAHILKKVHKVKGHPLGLACRRGTVMADGRLSPDEEHEDETVRYAPTSAGPDADRFATLYALSWPAHGTRHA